MKLITLNIWGGHVYSPLIEFIRTHQDIDIFCFQEVYHNAPEKISDEDRKVRLTIFAELQKLLPDHQGYFRPVVDDVFGIGMFVKKNLSVLAEGEVKIHENPDYPGTGPTHSRNLQWVQCYDGAKKYTIVNVHGLWNGRGKTDTPERLAQSQKIKAFIDQIDTPTVMCGDFNLRPDTESLKMLEQRMQNLVKQYHVDSTRTSYYPKAEKFADYIFTSPEVAVNQFAVLKDEVSDHAPLLLEFV